MNSVLAERLRSLQLDRNRSLEWWTETALQLVAELRLTLGEEVHHDSTPWVDLRAAAFSLWFWSAADSNRPLSFGWSGVMGGGLVDDALVVDADVFVFHPACRARLHTQDGKHFIRIRFDVESARWDIEGWVDDEFDEWDGVAYPKE